MCWSSGPGSLISIILWLSSLGISIYAGYTVGTNPPESGSSSLYMLSSIICVIQCIVYSGAFIYVPVKYSLKSHWSGYTPLQESKPQLTLSLLPLSIGIYWVVMHFLYDISHEYNEYAFVQMIIFFIQLVIFVLRYILGNNTPRITT